MSVDDKINSGLCNERQLHFKINILGEEYLYLYIRKNGCSSWKYLFAGESKYSEEAKDYKNLLGFMGKYHKVNEISKLSQIDNKLVVLRDPVQRFFSGFINQFLMRFDRRIGLHLDVENKVGMKLEDITFKKFVDLYLLPAVENNIDAHFWRQTSHLAPIEYNKFWMLEELQEKTKEAFSPEISNRYFSKKRNSTSNIPTYDDDSSEVPCGLLFQTYKCKGQLPSFNALIDQEASEKILEYYKDDVALIRKII